jgi:hypothetical protein
LKISKVSAVRLVTCHSRDCITSPAHWTLAPAGISLEPELRQQLIWRWMALTLTGGSEASFAYHSHRRL